MRGRLNADVLHVFSGDPAIDTGVDEEDKETQAAKLKTFAEAFKKMIDDGDPAVLPLKNGRQPVAWKLRSLSLQTYSDLGAEHPIRADVPTRDQIRHLTWWMRCGVVGADGLTGRNGRPLEFKTMDVPGGKALTAAVAEEIFALYGPGCIAELARRVAAICDISPL